MQGQKQNLLSQAKQENRQKKQTAETQSKKRALLAEPKSRLRTKGDVRAGRHEEVHLGTCGSEHPLCCREESREICSNARIWGRSNFCV